MKKVFSKIQRKFLLGIFKLRRIIDRLFAMRKLDYQQKDIFMLTDTIREYETRARSVIKEPKTVLWIEKYGGDSAVLYDIGANTGAYSLIAAARGAQVVAFEPASQNVYKLYKNALLNKLNEHIIVVPLILEANNGTAKSFIKNRTFGATHGFSLGEQSSDTVAGETFLAMGLDNCIQTFSLPIPTMIKIDVDGAEVNVLKGAQKLLINPILTTLLIETDDVHIEVILSLCTSAGFMLVDEERSGSKAINYIFERTIC